MKLVIDSTAVLELLAHGRDLPAEHQFLAPTLIRSEILDALYEQVRSGDLEEQDARSQLARFATMKIRYLGDKVLRRRAWDIATERSWESTRDGEYVALTQLQADALVTNDARLTKRVRGLVELETL